MNSRHAFLLLLDSCDSGQKVSTKKRGGSIHYAGKLCNPSSISTLRSSGDILEEQQQDDRE